MAKIKALKAETCPLPISPRRNELNGRDLTSDSEISVDDEESLVVLLDWILSEEGY